MIAAKLLLHRPSLNGRIFFGIAVVLATALWGASLERAAADPTTPFEGVKSDWHGFDRYDYVMDNDTLAITPATAGANQKGVQCIVVVPKQAAPGNPWSWRGCYWDHQPQSEIELLKRGFCIVFAGQDPDKRWDAWYDFLTQQHGLSPKPVFVGMSRGGINAFTWAALHPDEVSAIYADNPGIKPESLEKLDLLAKNDVPILLVCGSLDPLLSDHGLVIENVYQQLGGRVSIMIKEGFAHHPHSLQDPKPIADFLEQSLQPPSTSEPPFVGEESPFFKRKFYYYSNEDIYQNYPSEKTYVTCRGPFFTPCYSRYHFGIKGTKAGGGVEVIAPNNPAPGNPWVFRIDSVPRNAVVDQALLAKGFYIVKGPVPFDNGPIPEELDLTYKYFVDHGFSPKPVMEGNGAAAGEAYAWASENPSMVSCIYGENPIMHSNLAKIAPIDNLEPLAKAGVPLFDVCGSLDPALNDTQTVADRYGKLGGKITVVVEDGKGHYPLVPNDPKPIIDFILKATAQ